MNPVHKSLVRPILLGGMERVPLVIVLFFAGLFVLFQTPAAIASGLLIAAVGIVVLRRTAEWDPEYFRVLHRRLKFGRYYGPVPLDAHRKEYSFWQL
ncbi:MAG: VirB3 family type IV secretion system protein [Rhodobacteraceae bacterium]|nr:VirB3 family type IV secretion system protein [Paracoccaceae bacterium]MCY4141993.1 VirB3 family type IV secretion system protein [Paracoccaceae bacterium]